MQHFHRLNRVLKEAFWQRLTQLLKGPCASVLNAERHRGDENGLVSRFIWVQTFEKLWTYLFRLMFFLLPSLLIYINTQWTLLIHCKLSYFICMIGLLKFVDSFSKPLVKHHLPSCLAAQYDFCFNCSEDLWTNSNWMEVVQCFRKTVLFWVVQNIKMISGAGSWTAVLKSVQMVILLLLLLPDCSLNY